MLSVRRRHFAPVVTAFTLTDVRGLTQFFDGRWPHHDDTSTDLRVESVDDAVEERVGYPEMLI